MNFPTFGTSVLDFDLLRAMNHGPLFWKTYNILKKEMAELDSKGYTGEGFFSRPYTLSGTVPLTRQVQDRKSVV